MFQSLTKVGESTILLHSRFLIFPQINGAFLSDKQPIHNDIIYQIESFIPINMQLVGKIIKG